MESVALAQCFAILLAALGPMAAPTLDPLWDGNTLPCLPASPFLCSTASRQSQL